jgi:hypothetical protein
VFVVDENGVTHLRPVSIGLESGGLVEIQSGLSEGENVVVVGQAALSDRDTVRIGSEYAVSK